MQLYRYTYEFKTDIWNGETEFQLKLLKYSVLKETKSSYIIRYLWNSKKQKVVPKVGTNIFARDTEEKALNDFLKRKEKQINILKWNLKRLEELVEKINKKQN